jgi:acetyl esterase/lipase
LRGALIAAISPWLVAGAAAPTAAPLSAHAAVAEESTRQGTFEYAPGLTLDAYWTNGMAEAPWVVLIHGGYWSEGSRRSYASTAARFRDAGFAAFSIDYRLSGAAIWPAPREDAITAIEWVKANAATFGIAPQRVVVLGDSAGGHIALSLATSGRGNHRVTGAVALSAPSDPYSAWRAGNTAAENSRAYRLAGAAFKLHRCKPVQRGSACWNRWLDSNTKMQAGKDDAPMLLVHAKMDPLVPLSQSAAFRTKVHSLGAAVKWLTPSNGDHGVGLLKARSTWDAVLQWAKLRTRV